MANSTTIPNLPPLLSLLPEALVWVNQDGVDYRATVSQIIAQGGGSGIIPVLVSSSGSLFARGMFSVRTSLGFFIGTLPALVSVPPATPIWIQDIDNSAGINAYTIDAALGDQISDHGVLGSNYTLSTSNTGLLLLANLTSWTVMPYGF